MESEFIVRSKSNWAIHVETKTAYDSWVLPPSLESLEHIVKDKSKNYATSEINPIIDHVFNSLKNNDKLFSEISTEFSKKIKTAIKLKYFGINRLDFSQGGDGLVVPTFVEIFYDVFFWAEKNNLSYISTLSDKKIYDKYYWAYNFKTELILKNMKKSA